jgi:hypothetical protein
MKKTLIAAGCLLMTTAFAQAPPAKPCTSPESSQFDFWLGNWDLTYNDSVHASNTITRELGDCVIQENFKDPVTKLNGKSWSVYNTRLKKWQQTWVDNQGGYIVLTGGMENGNMILSTFPFKTPKGTTVQNRMIYSNIKPDSLDWSWESTNDEGKTWTVNWKIHYKRI